MSELALPGTNDPSLDALAASVLHEVATPFRASTSPCVNEQAARAGVEQLFRLLAHRVGDPELDSVGAEILAGLRRWFSGGELVKLADRYEPFAKFLLRLITPSKYAQLQVEAGNRLSAAKVLKALGLVNNKAMSAFESCSWEQFPPPDVQGKPHFIEHIARTYVFRNVEDHQARVLNQREKAQVAESICVFLVWCAIKFDKEISDALTRARFSSYLENLRDRFAEIGTRSVALITEARPLEEYRRLDPCRPCRKQRPLVRWQTQPACPTQTVSRSSRASRAQAKLPPLSFSLGGRQRPCSPRNLAAAMYQFTLS